MHIYIQNCVCLTCVLKRRVNQSSQTHLRTNRIFNLFKLKTLVSLNKVYKFSGARKFINHVLFILHICTLRYTSIYIGIMYCIVHTSILSAQKKPNSHKLNSYADIYSLFEHTTYCKRKAALDTPLLICVWFLLFAVSAINCFKN